ncbi:MAG: ComEC/Rec2 family competence protein [Prevotella sp.]|nr:ComEC/Rec2 family competence protein [Prevotella sp.]
MMRKATFVQFYPMVAVALALVVGIVVGGRSSGDVSPWVWLWVAVGGVVAAALSRSQGSIATLCLLVAVVGAGGWRGSEAERGLHLELPDEPLTYDAVVMSEPQQRGRVVSCDLLLTSTQPMVRARASILRDTVAHRYRHLHLGDGIKARSLLEHPHGYAHSRSDYGRYLLVHGVQAQTFIYYNQWCKAHLKPHGMPLGQRLQLRFRQLRAKLLATVDTSMMAPESRAVLAAVALGDRSGIDKQLRSQYATAGAAHVLALSGMHLAVIYMMLRLLLPGLRRRLLGELLLLAMVWGYVLLAGMSPSLLRSATMLTIYATLRVAHRGGKEVNVLSFAAVVLLLADPLMVYDVGFQLSFLSVWGIVVLLPLFERLVPARLRPGGRVGRWLSSTVLLPIAAQVATAPLVAYCFGRLPVYFLLTNLVAAPMMSVVLPLAIVYFLTPSIAVLHTLLARLLSLLIGGMNSALERIASLPGASIEGLSPTAAEVVVAYAAVVAVWLLLRRYVANKQLGDLQVDYS